METRYTTSVLWLLVFTLGALLFYVKRKFYTYDKGFLELAAKFPGPKPLPLIGNGDRFVGAGPQEFFRILTELCETYDPAVGFWLGSEFYVAIKKVQDAEVILNAKTRTEKADSYNIIDTAIENGIITSTGNKWRKHRKLLNPMFYTNTLPYHLKVFSAKVLQLCDKLEARVGDPECNIIPYIEESTFNILIGSSVIHENESEFVAEVSKVVLVLKKVVGEMVCRMFKPWLYCEFIYQLFPRSKVFEANMNYLRNLITLMIENTKKELQTKESKFSKESNFEKEGGPFTEFLVNILTDSANQLTQKDILIEMCSIYAASFDTTVASIGFILYLLSNHIDVQNKLVEEIRLQFGSLEEVRPMTFDDVLNMKYLDRVVKEGLRLYPTVPYIARKMLDDTKLPSGRTLPKGSSVLLFFYAVHRDPDMFPNPDRFDPDNFLPEKVAARHPLAFMPFSSGPRNCLGQKFAVLNVKAHIVALLRRFAFTPGRTQPKVMSTLSLQSATGVHVNIRRRTDA